MRDQFRDGRIHLDEAVAFWIVRASGLLRGRSFGALREHGFDGTPEQWMVMVRLWERDGQTQGELAEGTFRDAPTMSRTIASMERAGWVARRPDPADRRARRVHLTRVGAALEAELVPVARWLVGEMLAGVPERDVQATIRTLRRIVDNLEPASR